jgi:hypothetical protein
VIKVILDHKVNLDLKVIPVPRDLKVILVRRVHRVIPVPRDLKVILVRRVYRVRLGPLAACLRPQMPAGEDSFITTCSQT